MFISIVDVYMCMYHQSLFPFEHSRSGTETPRHRKPPALRLCGGVPSVPNTTSSNSKRDLHYSDTRYSPAQMCRRSYLLQRTQSMAPETQMERIYDLNVCAPPRQSAKTFCHAFARLASARRLKCLFPAGPSLKGLFPGMLP